ncbi:MAG: RND family transporter [Pirellulales bacterium]
MRRSTLIRCTLLTLLVMGAVIVPMQRQSQRTVETMFNAPLRWIPRDFPARREFNQFVEEFDSHEMVLVSWPGCTVDDPRLERFADALLAARDSRRSAGQQEMFSQVLTGSAMVRRLMGEAANLSRRQAIERLEGTLIGKDGQTSCAVVVFTDYGALNRRDAVDIILATARRTMGKQREDLYLAGPPIDGISIDTESIRSIQRFAIPTAVISFLLCWACLRSFWLTLPIVTVGAFGQVLMLASVGWIGARMNAILIVLPPLIFVLTVSAGVHLMNYFYDELRSGSRKGATSRALAKAWGPCALAAITTAIGLASLLVSDVRPVQEFGALAALGVLATVLLLFLVVPGSIELWLRWVETPAASARTTEDLGNRSRDVWEWMATTIRRRASLLTASCFVLLGLTGTGLVWLRTSVSVTALLAPDNRAVQDVRWFESHIGPLVPVEVIFHFSPACRLDPLQRMELVRYAGHQIEEIPILDGAMSAASFYPEIPPAGGIGRTARRSILKRQIVERKNELIDAHYVHSGPRGEAWRISARVYGNAQVDYGRFLQRLREQVEPIVVSYREHRFEGIRVTYTGVTPVVYDVQRALLSDLFRSFNTALVLVALIMMFSLHSLPAGLVAMIPNIFPTIILFGSMGWLGRRVDIGTVMTASVALGIAVDGTFHFLKWFRREIKAGQSRGEAVDYSLHHCGRALAQTTIICALGLLVCGTSGFLPARHFAWTLLLLLVAAMIGDLLVLPALLVSPLGKFFQRPCRPSRTMQGAAAEPLEPQPACRL